MGASRTCSSYTKVEVSTQMPMVASLNRRTGQKSQARAQTGRLCSCLAARPDKATVSINPTPNARPSSPLLCRRLT